MPKIAPSQYSKLARINDFGNIFPYLKLKDQWALINIVI